MSAAVDAHASSIVDPRARVGAGVRIGPFCWVGPEVTLEDGVVLDSGVRVDGRTTLRRGVHVHHGAALGGPPQDLKYRPGIVSSLDIGEQTVIREYVTAHTASDDGAVTRVGARCLLMAYVHVAHNVEIADDVILANGVQLAGYVKVEERAIIGGLVPVHQFVRIGCHAFVGGGYRVPQDVAPYVRAAGYPLRPMGLNTVGLARRGFPAATVAALRHAYRLLFRSDLTVAEAAARIRAEVAPLPEVERFVGFALASERGLAR